MDRPLQDPMPQVSVLQQCLSGGRRPIGLLIGAGCPMAVRSVSGDSLIPDIAGITRRVREELSGCDDIRDSFETAYEHLKSDGSQCPTVEELLTHIRALAAVVGNDTVRDLSGDQLDNLDRRICDLIHEVVNVELPDERTPYHRVALWVNAIPRDFPIEIFTTNYDLLMEQALEESRVSYFDGFPGARKPFFDPFAIEQDAPLPQWTRLWKLHGSINWYQDDQSEVFRGTASESGPRRIIHPSHLKYQESRRMPYLAMSDRLRSFLRDSRAALVICGYSFRDEHINEIIIQGLQQSQTSVTFALMFGNIEDHRNVVSLAEKRPNLNVLALNGGVIGGRYVKWIERDSDSAIPSESEAVVWTLTDPNEEDSRLRAEFRLGDFATFGQFLLQLLGGDYDRQEGSENAS